MPVLRTKNGGSFTFSPEWYPDLVQLLPVISIVKHTVKTVQSYSESLNFEDIQDTLDRNKDVDPHSQSIKSDHDNVTSVINFSM